MLQFLVVFFGVFISIMSVNDFNKYITITDNIKEQKISFYINSLFNQQYYLYSFCIKGHKCNEQNYSDLKLYLPPELIASDWRKHVFVCYGKRGGVTTLVTGINPDSFNDSFIHEAKQFMKNHADDVQMIRLITNNDEYPDVDDCVNRKGGQGERVLLLSTTYVE